MRKLFLILLLMTQCVCYQLQAQSFQATTGTALTEDHWGTVEDPAINGYVTIGNSISSSGSKNVWISSYTVSGTVSTSNIVTNSRPMVARDISLAPMDAATGQRTYYITGWTNVVNSLGVTINQMFVGRIYLSGAFMWYKETPVAGTGKHQEGVSITTAPNGDAVAVGHLLNPTMSTTTGGYRTFMARFSSAGTVLWTNVYNTSGNWMVRKIANAVPAPGCTASPTSTPGEFIITGEAYTSLVSGISSSQATTFAAVINGAGVECWRYLYPATTSTFSTTGDAGYDVVYNSSTNHYCVVGAAETASGRATTNSTPYLLELNTSGSVVNAAIYTTSGHTALGLYPRSVAFDSAAGKIVFAGPDFSSSRTFMGWVSTIGGAATLYNYTGAATANSVTQPYWLNDGPHEDILKIQLSTTTPGYLVTTNAIGGTYGSGDGQFIRTNSAGQTPSACANVSIGSAAVSTSNATSVTTTKFAYSQWATASTSNSSYTVAQTLCTSPCSITPLFSYTASGTTLTFTNTSTGTGSLTYLWNFGDGTSSTATNPVHTFASGGTYTVCLTVYNALPTGDTCSATVCHDIVVTACDVHSSFTYSVACKYKVTYAATSTGTGALTYNWLFDDATTSSISNPVKTYTTCGTHATRLITCNYNCCDTSYITTVVPCCSVVSDFCLQDSGTSVKLIYNPAMNATVTTYTVYVDGVLTAWTANANKILTAGIHTVCLKARRVSCPGDTCCATCCKTISVSAPCALSADYWYQVQTTGAIVFTNKTTPTTGFTSFWDFGDGTNTTTASPTHTYTAAGTYTACLTTTIISGVDTCVSKVCKTIVLDALCKPMAKFYSKYCLASPLDVSFTNLSSGATSYVWDFGDGTTSTATNPVHTYAASGTYIVCLNANVSSGCWSTTCYRVVVSTASCTSSCATLPAAPAFRMGQQLIRSEELNLPMTLQHASNSENVQVKDMTNVLSEQMKKDLSVSQDHLSLYPNPASKLIQVVFETSGATPGEIIIANALGEIMLHKSVQCVSGKNQFTIPIEQLSPGGYFLRLNTQDKIHSALFTVRK